MTKKKKIVLFNPLADKERKVVLFPLSLLAIAAIPYAQGYEVKIFKSGFDDNCEEKVIQECQDALCLGVTALTGHQIFDGLKVCRQVKNKYPDLPIIWGGWHPTVDPEATIKNENIDIVVRGQGERTFAELVEAFYNKKSIANIKGISYKINGKIIHNPYREIEDINNFPFLPYQILDVEKYLRSKKKKLRTIEYRSSQGCFYRCKFCAEFRMSNMKWHGLKAERVLDELENLVKDYNIEYVDFFENNFFLDKNRSKKIFEGLLARNIKCRLGNLNATIKNLLTFDDELWSLIKKVNCQDILVGVESGNQKILDYVNKRITLKDIIEMKKRCHQYDVRTFISLIFGLPYKGVSHKEELTDLLNLIKKIRAVDNNNLFFINIYLPYPGTETFEDAVKMGFKAPGTLDEWAVTDVTTVKVPWIPKKYEKIIYILNTYILAYTTKISKTDWMNITNKPGLKQLVILAHSILRNLAVIRLKFNFFYFPVEYWFIKLFSKFKKKL